MKERGVTDVDIFASYPKQKAKNQSSPSKQLSRIENENGVKFV